MPSLSEALLTFSAVIVTGGSSGIGKSFIELGQKLNPELVFCNLSRRSPTVNNLAKKLNHFACDLSRAEDVARVVPELITLLEKTTPSGRILLINNSGFGAYGHFPEPNLAHHLEMVDVNVRAVIHVTGLLLPFLKTRGGVIMTVASTAAFQPTAFMATYGATKAFVLHWSLALHEELRGSGVTTLAVCPGPTETEFYRRAGLAKGSVGEAVSMTGEAVVTAAFRALGAGQVQVVPGWKNQLYTFASSKISKPLAARIGAHVIGRVRLNKVKR